MMDMQAEKSPINTTLKKYVVHQKVNNNTLGIEVFNQNIAIPYKAYLICKLIYKEDIHSLKDIEDIVFNIKSAWNTEKKEIWIKKINVFTSETYVQVTFTLGFFQKEYAQNLPFIKEWVRKEIEDYKKKNIEYTNDLLYKILSQVEKLGMKVKKIENHLQKNETFMIDSTKHIREEISQIKTIKKEIFKDSEVYKQHNVFFVPKDQQIQTIHRTRIKLKKRKSLENDSSSKDNRKYSLVRAKVKHEGTQLSIRYKKVNLSIKRQKNDKNINMIENISEQEKKIIYYFQEISVTDRKQVVAKKKFLEWKAKVEYIDYLWKMFETEKGVELKIAGELSCKQLIEELPNIIVTIEDVANSTKFFNYWIYCPQKILTKLKGYVALAELLDGILDKSKSGAVVMVS